MDYLREGIHLRGFAQIDPLVAYKNEGFAMFRELMDSIWEEFTRVIFHVEVNIEPAAAQEMFGPGDRPAGREMQYAGGGPEQPSAMSQAAERAAGGAGGHGRDSSGRGPRFGRARRGRQPEHGRQGRRSRRSAATTPAGAARARSTRSATGREAGGRAGPRPPGRPRLRLRNVPSDAPRPVPVTPGLAEGPDGRPRCWWGIGSADYLAYHDDEWGRPVRDDRGIFERLTLEAFQSGLSWLTILRKREGFRAAFAGFDFDRVAAYGERDVERLMGDAAIVRNRAKIEATIANARAARELAAAGDSLAQLAWSFRPEREPARGDGSEPPAITAESKALAKALRARGFRFVGPTTAYALMQAVGIVNDHLAGCAVRDAVEAERALEGPQP